jgi:SAM-dependent methyltransferase
MKCHDCPKRTDLRCTAYDEVSQTAGRDIPPHPFSGCIIPIVEGYMALIKSGMRVLEIGCGTWSKIKDRCDDAGASYDAIDVAAEYYGKPTVATRIENLADLSFEKDQFDLVIGNQTLEHWGEYGCRTLWGLQRCFDVTKMGGQVIMNVPIHFHGVDPFLSGRMDAIRALFGPFSNSVELIEWGKDSAPLLPYFAHPRYTPLQQKQAYTLDIRAKKDKVADRRFDRGFAPNGRLAQAINTPPSYVLHQILIRTGLKQAD